MANHKLSEILTKKQKICWRSLKDKSVNFVLYGGGAGGGKSFLGCTWVFINCLKYSGTRWVIGRSVLKRLKETTLKTLFEVFNLFEFKDYKYNVIEGVIILGNGSEILLKDLYEQPSDKNFDSLGSLEITGAFVDECSQITQRAKDVLLSRIRFKLDENNLTPTLLGTCNPSKGWVYQELYKPFKENKLPSNKVFIQSLADDNPHIESTYIKSLESIQDKATVKRLRFGLWEYSDNPYKLIEYDAILDLYTNVVKGGNKFISCDVARFGEDKTVFIVWDGLNIIEILAYKKTAIDEIVTILNELQKKHVVRKSNIIVDSDGVGGGVKDVAKVRGFTNGARAVSGNYFNLKSQCYYKLAECINLGLISISVQDYKEELIEELEIVEAAQTTDDKKLRIISKDKVKELLGRSPDYSDALMMRMYYELKTKTKAVVKRI